MTLHNTLGDTLELPQRIIATVIKLCVELPHTRPGTCSLRLTLPHENSPRLFE